MKMDYFELNRNKT